MLVKVLEETGLMLETNIKSGIKASGLIPLNRTVVLNKLQKEPTNDITENWFTTFLTFLRDRITENEPRKKT